MYIAPTQVYCLIILCLTCIWPKNIVSIVHSTIIFSSVFLNIREYVSINEKRDVITLSLIYLLIDSFVFPRKRHKSIYFHHILVIFSELYLLYGNGINYAMYSIVYYSYLGECFSVFDHSRKMVYPGLKHLLDFLTVLSFFITRIILPPTLFVFFGNDIPYHLNFIYPCYIFLNFYWGNIIFRKVMKKLM